jgi:hypothetical protein
VGVMLKKVNDYENRWEYQYDGRESFREILAWCRENFGTRCWNNDFETIWLYGDDAAMLFLLRWS